MLEKIHGSVQADMSEWGYRVQTFSELRGKIILWKLSTDDDIALFLRKYKDQDLVVYVSLKKINNRGNATAYEYERIERDFVHIPQNTRVHATDIGPSTVPQVFSSQVPNDQLFSSTSKDHTSQFESNVRDDGDRHSTFDNDNDLLDEEPLHEESLREFHNFCTYFDTRCPPEPRVSEWRLPELPPSLSPDHPAQHFTSDSTTGQLSMNITFSSRSEMEDVVGAYHLKNKVRYWVERADKCRWYLKCKHSECKFILHATCKYDVWQVVKLTIPHTCTLNPDVTAPTSMNAKFLGRIFAKKFMGSTLKYTPKYIQNELRDEHGLSVNYELARMVKGHAIATLYGDGVSSFNKLPGYLYQLKMANDGSYTNLLTDDMNVFKYAFFALKTSIDGFKRYGRPVIVIDGTHLKGKYCGMLFVAVTHDGNGQIFPLATGVGDVECNESWTWFLRCLRETYDCPPHLLFVSDQHASIIHSVAAVYHEAKHGFCYYHLKQKLVKYGKHVVQQFYQAAYTHRHSEYLSCMDTLQRADPSGRLMHKLNTTDPKRWARVCCPVKHYEFMTSNAAESWNKKLLWARRLPVVSMLECVRTIIESWFTERRDAAWAHKQILCPEVSKKMIDVKMQASKLVVTSLGDNQYKVSVFPEFFIVDLMHGKCDCEEFQGLLMSCTHAAAAIRYANYPISEFVNHYYKTECLRGMWGGKIVPVPHPDHWDNPEWVNSTRCYPPTQPRQAGRPRQSRRSSGLETSTSRRKPHVRSTCQESATTINVPEAPRRVVVRKCSICGEPGHNKRSCSKRNS